MTPLNSPFNVNPNTDPQTVAPQPNVIPNENHVLNIEGFIDTFTEAPTYTPKKLSHQLVLVRAGGSTSAYIYDTRNTQWNQVSLTSI